MLVSLRDSSFPSQFLDSAESVGGWAIQLHTQRPP